MIESIRRKCPFHIFVILVSPSRQLGLSVCSVFFSVGYSGEVLVWLSVWSAVQTCTCPADATALTISCSSKIQIGFTFLVLAHPGSPGQRAVKHVCVSYCSEQYVHSVDNTVEENFMVFSLIRMQAIKL